MKKVLELKRMLGMVLFSFLLLVSCDDKIDFTSNDAQSVENEATTDSYFEDADDMSSVAVWSDEATKGGKVASSGARKITLSDLRMACATVEIVPAADSQIDFPKGTITIDFGSGCTDSRNNVRAGKIMVTYAGKRYSPGSTRTVTLEGYSINGVKVEGVRNVTNIAGSTDESPKFRIEVIGGKATWPDGSIATREVRRIREWKRAASPLQDEWEVSQPADADFAASGTNRNGKAYQVNITSAIIYKRECAVSARVFMAVQGTKELIVDGKKITIDYGSGECDRIVTITVNGKTEQVTVRGDI